jgi:hypothetical protein
VSAPKLAWDLLRPDGLFRIRPAQDSDAYVLTEMTEGSFEDGYRTFPFAPLFAGLTMAGPIADYVRRLRVVGLSECEWQGRQLTQLRMRQWQGQRNKWNNVTLYFDPNDHWLLHGLETQEERGPGRGIITYHYGPRRDGVAVLQRIEWYTTNQTEPPGPLKLRILTECVEFASARPDDSEFSLQRFGLPEPAPATSEKASLGHLWFFLAAGVVAALAFSLYRFTSVRQPSASG